MSKRLNNKTKLVTLGTIASLATLPTIGVFAATGTTVTDTVEVTIDSACTITTTNLSNTYSATMTNGQLKSDFGSTNMTINCNDAGGWHLTAVGTGADASDKTVMNATSTGTDIATGTATSGNTSNWAMKVTGTGATGFTTFQPIPSVATNVAGDDNPVANATLNTTYQVFISSTQQADTYTGQVTYTLAHPYEQAPPPTLEDVFDAVVGVENKTTYNGQQYYKMQDMTASICSQAGVKGEGSQMQLLDDRTNSDGTKGVYWVTKLDDDNCWMTQNLDLDIEAGRTYTSADTDLANSTIGTSWTPTASTSTTSSWTSSTTVPSSYNPGNLYWNGWVTTGGGTLSDRTTTDPSATSGGTHYHIGNYYNWTAAVAMNDSSSYTTQYTDVNQSICPAGWRLPTYSDNKSYQNLVSMQSLTAGTSGNIQNSPVYFVYGGGWSGSTRSVGYSGYYWSSSVVGNSNIAYRLSFNADGFLDPQNNSLRGNGCLMRCVARQQCSLVFSTSSLSETS